MKKIKHLVIFMLININILGLLCACGAKEDNKDIVSFRYAAASSDYNASLYYSDDYFSLKATDYNPSLATLSLGLAMSAFMSLDVEDISDYLLIRCGFLVYI